MENDLYEYIVKTGTAEQKIEKIVVFGSRARGDHHEKSDYDVAVFGMFSEEEKAKIEYALKYDSPVLNKIDVVFFHDCKNEKLKQNILKEGKTVYDKNENQVR